MAPQLAALCLAFCVSSLLSPLALGESPASLQQNAGYLRKASRASCPTQLPVGGGISAVQRLMRTKWEDADELVREEDPSLLLQMPLMSSIVSLPTITEILTQYGLPVGLIPSDVVTSYTLSENGRFEVRLARECYAKFEYQVYYAKKISGKISCGSISDLSGIEAKELFFWVSVTGIRVDMPSNGYIYFEIGVITKRLPLSLFDEVLRCRSRARSSLAGL